MGEQWPRVAEQCWLVFDVRRIDGRNFAVRCGFQLLFDFVEVFGCQEIVGDAATERIIVEITCQQYVAVPSGIQLGKCSCSVRKLGVLLPLDFQYIIYELAATLRNGDAKRLRLILPVLARWLMVYEYIQFGLGTLEGHPNLKDATRGKTEVAPMAFRVFCGRSFEYLRRVDGRTVDAPGCPATRYAPDDSSCDRSVVIGFWFGSVFSRLRDANRQRKRCSSV